MSTQTVRIAYLISKYPAVSMTFILREVLTLRARGFDIEVASINAGPPYESLTQVERDEVAQTFYIKQQGAGGSFKALGWLLLRRPGALFRGVWSALSLGSPDPARIVLCLFYLIEAAILVRWMRQRSLTHMHIHFASQAAAVGTLATYLAPVTLSITVHGPDEFYDVPGFFLPAKIARARFLVCISFFTQSQIMKVSNGRHWQKFDVSRLGVDTEHFVPRPFRAAPEPFEILCVGRLVSTKGQRILIEVIHRLKQSALSVHLTLVGDGPDRDDLETHVRDRHLESQVTFTGSVNQDEIQAYFTASDIFVLASFAEGIPVALMEAMAMEIPCIATIINGIPELITDGVDGLLVSPSDSDGLANAITRLIRDPLLRQTLGMAGRVRVQEAYELNKNADHLAEIFRRRLA
jgi:colanic acid/amylovoran biosynthesis glycosyltransferase